MKNKTKQKNVKKNLFILKTKQNKTSKNKTKQKQNKELQKTKNMRISGLSPFFNLQNNSN